MKLAVVDGTSNGRRAVTSRMRKKIKREGGKILGVKMIIENE